MFSPHLWKRAAVFQVHEIDRVLTAGSEIERGRLPIELVIAVEGFGNAVLAIDEGAEVAPINRLQFCTRVIPLCERVRIEWLLVVHANLRLISLRLDQENFRRVRI